MLLLDGQVHHDTHAIPMGNYVIGVGNYVIATPSELGNYKIADTQGEQRDQRMLTRRPEPAATSNPPSSLGSRAVAWDSHILFDGVLVEPGDSGQPTGEGGGHAPCGVRSLHAL